MSGPTQGEWFFDEGDDCGEVEALSADRTMVARGLATVLIDREENDGEEDIANGQLMAASKDLLAACKALDEIDWILGYEMTLENCEVVDKALQIARTAIRKAETGS